MNLEGLNRIFAGHPHWTMQQNCITTQVFVHPDAESSFQQGPTRSLWKDLEAFKPASAEAGDTMPTVAQPSMILTL